MRSRAPLRVLETTAGEEGDVRRRLNHSFAELLHVFDQTIGHYFEACSRDTLSVWQRQLVGRYRRYSLRAFLDRYAGNDIPTGEARALGEISRYPANHLPALYLLVRKIAQ